MIDECTAEAVGEHRQKAEWLAEERAKVAAVHQQQKEAVQTNKMEN
jgi:hypothetical protein